MPIIDAARLPGLCLLAIELGALAGLGYTVIRVLLGQRCGYLAAAQGLVVGLVLWGALLNALFYLVPGFNAVILTWLCVGILTIILVRKGRVRPYPRFLAAATFATVVFAVFWVALSARQLLWVPDIGAHIPLTASMMVGNFPPTFPWNPSEPSFYHYGPDLLIGGLEAGTGLGYVIVT